MPNWCSTTFSFYHNGTKEGEAALADLHDKIEEYTKEPSRVKNGFGPKWLGNVADGFGIDWNTVECRGEIIDITDVENDSGRRAFRVYTETAWGPMPDMWEKIIGQRYQDQIMFEYIAEEPGNEGRILVRPSGTEPLVRVMVEAKTDELCDLYVSRVVDFIEQKGY